MSDVQGRKMKSAFKGSSAKLTSAANEEICKKGECYEKFDFYNYQDCTVKINGSAPIFLGAGQGFSTDRFDEPIYSFIVVEAGIDYNWIGTQL